MPSHSYIIIIIHAVIFIYNVHAAAFVYMTPHLYTCRHIYIHAIALGREPEWINPQIEDGKLPEMPNNLIKNYESSAASETQYSQIGMWICTFCGLVHSGSRPMTSYMQLLYIPAVMYIAPCIYNYAQIVHF